MQTRHAAALAEEQARAAAVQAELQAHLTLLEGTLEGERSSLQASKAAVIQLERSLAAAEATAARSQVCVPGAQRIPHSHMTRHVACIQASGPLNKCSYP